MKITELTQKSHSEQLSEDRSKLDELAPLVTAGIGGGITYAMLASQYGANPLKWPKEAYAELAADAALGATGVGLYGVGAKALGKLSAKGVTNALKTAKQKKIDAEAELKNATPPKSKLERDRDEVMKKQGKEPPKTPAQTAAQKKLDDANAELKATQKAYDDKVGPPPSVADKVGGVVKKTGQSLGLGSTVNFGSDITRGERIIDPSSVPILGKDMKPGDAPGADNVKKRKLFQPPPHDKSASQAKRLMGINQ